MRVSTYSFCPLQEYLKEMTQGAKSQKWNHVASSTVSMHVVTLYASQQRFSTLNALRCVGFNCQNS